MAPTKYLTSACSHCNKQFQVSEDTFRDHVNLYCLENSFSLAAKEAEKKKAAAVAAAEEAKAPKIGDNKKTGRGNKFSNVLKK